MFKIDLHVHTTLGKDSLIRPDELAALARAAGLDAVCVTEHHSYHASEPLERIAQERGFPIFRALEYHAAEGHLLVFGVEAGGSDFPRSLPIQHALDWVQARGGVAVPAHPYQRGLLGTSLGNRLLELQGLIAVEAVNGSCTPEENRRAWEAMDRLGIRGIGGSDAHGPSVLGCAYTEFCRPIASQQELVKALKTGGYRPRWNGTGRPTR